MAKTEIGEMRNQLARDLQGSLERTIQRYKDKKEPYFLLVHAEMVDNNIATKIIRLEEQPPRMLGTMLYRVDNRKGQLRRIWCLPQDIPVNPYVLSDKGMSEEVFKSAQGLPIIYGGD